LQKKSLRHLCDELLLRGYRPVFLIVALAGLALDLLTKRALFHWPGSRDPIVLIPGFLKLESAVNRGGLFGLGQGRVWFFVLFSLAAIAYLLYYLARSDPRRLLPNLAVGVLLGGALGNLLDRLALGYVRDFIAMHYRRWQWPNYNVADILICLGIGLLLLEIIIARPEKEGEPAS
jgi:signal peptidase II